MLRVLLAICIGLSFSPLANSNNLSTCLSGKYPLLCDKSLLTPEQRRDAAHAEKAENLKTCMIGKYPSLCRKELLTPQELASVQEAERRENLKVCITGKYPSLCKHAALTREERARVEAAEKKENLATCLTGRYPSLCKKSLLSIDQQAQVEAAEKKFGKSQGLRSTSRAQGVSGCEPGHWVMEVISDGAYVKLEDGSLWEIDAAYQIDTMLWLPTTDIIACSDKLINTDDNETVDAMRIR